jgi:hypothetical protein
MGVFEENGGLNCGLRGLREINARIFFTFGLKTAWLSEIKGHPS